VAVPPLKPSMLPPDGGKPGVEEAEHRAPEVRLVPGCRFTG
jgi:hypothetical protein